METKEKLGEEIKLVEIYCANINLLPDEITPFFAFVSKERLKKINAKKKSDDKKRSLLAGLLIYKNICNDVNILKESVNEFGKPKINGCKSFSISHSGDYVIMAVSDFSVGIDIEMHKDEDYERLAKAAFHSDEQKYIINSNSPKEDFFKLWTLKESYMKAIGRGFNLSPKSFCFNINNDEIQMFENEKWNFTVINSILKYTISVCSKEECGSTVIFQNLQDLIGTKYE